MIPPRSFLKRGRAPFVLCLAAALAFRAWKSFAPPRGGASGSATATILETSGGSAKARVAGGAVIVDADGRALELTPPKRPASMPKIALPTLDDPAAGLEARKRRAQRILFGSAFLAAALSYWARRWRSG